jgi:hypothetical protein
MSADHVRQVRLLAKLLRELLATPDACACDSLGAVADALKWRCARLHIRWTNDDLNSAFTMIASNTPLLGVSELPVLPSQLRSQNERREPGRAISRAEAAAILARLGIEL